jgi:drug/metabolite transporter (DMT)-like permease
MALAVALASASCFAAALITVRIGLRRMPVRVGAAFSVPSAFALFVLLSPFSIDWSGFVPQAALAFAAIGLFFPAAVTILTFQATERFGAPITGAINGSSPLFALPAAALALGEAVPAHAVVATVGIVIGVAVLSLQRRAGAIALGQLWIPMLSAAVRGLSQVAIKAALLLWPSAFAATLIGYGVSSMVLLAIRRGIGTGAVDQAPATSLAPAATVTKPPLDRRSVAWFVATGLFNGTGVLLLYWSLAHGPVALVAPVVATIPLLAILFGRFLLPGERLTRQSLAGILITVASVIYLVRG